ncbi:MAG: ROK family protein [Candidatus Altiarchaeales archaeon]|nr:ROK family protein [Candidatus Altiarchaeales archaeon]
MGLGGLTKTAVMQAGGELAVPQKIGGLARQVEFAVTLVDVGGTKEKALVVGVDREGNLLRDVVLYSEEAKTQKGVKSHYDGLAGLIERVQANAGSGVRVLPIVCVGSPGRFVDGVIQPGSAGNLGTTKHEFDGINPAVELGNRLPAKVFVGNDAVAQMGAALGILLASPETAAKVKGKKLAYIGPGTGLGGGFARVDSEGNITFMTDGHIYDILIPGYEHKNEFNFIVDGKKIKARLPVEALKAEDLLSGRAVRQIACALDRAALKDGLKPVFLPILPGFESFSPREYDRLLDHSNNKEPVGDLAKHINQRALVSDTPEALRARPIAEQIVIFQGLMLGKMIELIHQGRIAKFDEKTARWPVEDKEDVKGTTDFIIGGSVLNSGRMGKMALARAREYLKKVFVVGFTIHHMEDIDLGEEAAYGTYNFAGKEEVKKAIQQAG